MKMRVRVRRGAGDPELVITASEGDLGVLAIGMAELATHAKDHPAAGPIADLAIAMLFELGGDAAPEEN